MRQMMVVFAVWVLLLIVGITAFLYSVLEGVFDPEFGSAVITSLLVFVTGISVFLNLLLIKENETARERENEPVFTISTEGIYANSYHLSIENIGNGPAQNVEVTVTTAPSDINAEIERKNVRPGDVCLNSYTRIQANHVPDQYNSVSITGSCEDIFGNSIPIDNEAKIENITANEEEIILRSENEELRKEIEGVSKSIDNIFDSLNMSEVDSLVKMENSRRVIACLEESDTLTFRELIQKMGVKYVDVLQTLIWLDSAGAIEYDKEEVFEMPNDPDTEITLAFERS